MFLCSLVALLSRRPRPEPVCFDGLLDELFEAWPLEPWEEGPEEMRRAA
jgi:hypothetical protein